jgi:hypothetical protein
VTKLELYGALRSEDFNAQRLCGAFRPPYPLAINQQCAIQPGSCAPRLGDAQRDRSMRGARARLAFFDNRINTGKRISQNFPKFPIPKKSSQLRDPVETGKPNPNSGWAGR